MTLVLAPKALERVRVSPVGCAFLPIFGPLDVLSLVSTYCSPLSWLADVLWLMVVCPRPVWLLWELGQPGALLSVHPFPWPLCLGLFGVLAGLLPCPALVRVAISLAIWCPKSVVPSPGSVVMAALALTLITGCLILTLCLAGGNHQLGISGPGVTIEIPYGISNMFVDPMEEMVFEVLLDF